MATVALKGSERLPVQSARVLGPADPTERLEVSLIVRRRAREVLHARAARLAAGDRSLGVLSREEFAIEHGADASDLAAIRQFASAQGLVVAHEHSGRRTVVLAGTVGHFSAAFAVQLYNVATPTGSYRGRTGAIHLPGDLDGIVEAVRGLDDGPHSKTHLKIYQRSGN